MECVRGREGGSGREIGEVGGRVASFSTWAQEGMHPESLMGKMGAIPPLLLQFEDTLPKPKLPSPGHDRANGIIRCATVAA